jgi:hypothetical protein
LKFRERWTVAFVTQPERRAVCAEPQLLRSGGSSYSEEHAWIFCSNGKLVFGMNQSLDGYVDHQEFSLFRHFIEQVSALTGSVYGRRLYEVMRYWDRDHPEWSAEEAASAAAWRRQPKWIVSRSLKSVGPHATLVGDDLEAAIRGLKARHEGNLYADRATPRSMHRR